MAPAVRARTWALAPVALLLAVAFCLVGAWQWRTAVTVPPSRLPTDAALPVERLAPAGSGLPVDALARTVVARGTYDKGEQLLVTGRRLDGRAGQWVLLPLRTTAGSVLPVVRAFVADGDPAPLAPRGEVEVRGRLQAPLVAEPLAGAPPGSTASVDPAELVNRWGGPMHPGFVVVEQERPAPAGAVVRVPAVPPSDGSAVDWRNAAYAVQWWVFAGFVLLLWARLARDDRRAGTAGPPYAPAVPPAERSTVE